MRKLCAVILSAVVWLVAAGTPASAAEHQSTLSAGYLQTHTDMPGSDNLNGINVKYRYEFTDTLGPVSYTHLDVYKRQGRTMLANTCTWTYRGDECGYHGPAVADEYDQPTSDITKDKCSKCLSGCKFRNNVGNFGGFLSINKLSQ